MVLSVNCRIRRQHHIRTCITEPWANAEPRTFSSQVTRTEDILNSIERRGLVSKLDQARLTVQMFVDQAWTWYWSKYDAVTNGIPHDK